MSASILSSKGQIVIPKEVRDKLGLHTGDRVQFVEDGAGFKLVPATRDIRELRGIVARPRRPVSIEQMNKAIAARAGKVLRSKR
jgi:antitoxin PrlF